MLDQNAILDANDVAAIQFTGWPKPENRPCTVTNSFSATIVPGSDFSVGGMLLMSLKRPSRPGSIWALSFSARVAPFVNGPVVWARHLGMIDFDNRSGWLNPRIPTLDGAIFGDKKGK
jgi:hypothetical protein